MMPLPSWSPDVWALLGPMLVVCGTALGVLCADLALRGRDLPWSIPSAMGLGIAALLASSRWDAPLPEAEAILGGAIRGDNLSVFLQIVVLVAAALALLAAERYLDTAGKLLRAEFHVLALLSTTGMLLLVSSGDLVTLFLGLELLSFPTYALCAFRRDDRKGNESGLKYFVLGSFASALFLYGVALVWGATGSTALAGFELASEPALVVLGMLLLLAGFLFKIGAAPFHMWVPDVYEGAPTPVTGFMATAIKVAAFGAFLRLFWGLLAAQMLPLDRLVWWLAVVTMTVGNLSALTQENVKRMLAFSSVAHAGYMLVGFAAVAASGWTTGAVSVLYYLVAYAGMNVGAFTVVALLGRRAEGDLVFDRDWAGAARRHPFLGVAMTVFMVALAGIPPTAGFVGKYSLFKSAIDAGLTSLVIIAVLNSLVSVYYYLRVVVAMYMKSERAPLGQMLEAVTQRLQTLEGPGAMAAADSSAAPRLAESGAWTMRAVVLVCLAATLWFGCGPSSGALPGVSRLLDWAEAAVTSLR